MMDHNPSLRTAPKVRWTRVVPIAVVYASVTLFTGILFGGVILLAMWAAWNKKRPQLLLDSLVGVAVVVVPYFGLLLAFSR